MNEPSKPEGEGAAAGPATPAARTGEGAATALKALIQRRGPVATQPPLPDDPDYPSVLPNA